MIETKQLFDIIDKNLLAELIEYYNSIGEYETTTMNKAGPGKALELLIDLLEEQLGKKLEFAQGNFYKHTQPYLPHTDYKTYQDGKINVVIPLQYTEIRPNLIVFDQYWELDSVTWCMHLPVIHYSINIGVKGCPYEYPVKGLTNTDIDNKLYVNHLMHFPKNTLHGLSGSALPFQPGSMIIFDARKLHCTSKMYGEKLGLSLRFK